jgi:hemolysin-activating ACP:hemolysin acyltransferase
LEERDRRCWKSPWLMGDGMGLLGWVAPVGELSCCLQLQVEWQSDFGE